jgi:hypothetical protein
MNELVVFRYLRFRSASRIIRGTSICKHLRIPLHRLRELDDMEGVASNGPVDYFPKRRQLAIRHAKRNGFSADFRFFFEYEGRYHCTKPRPLRKRCWPPRTARPRAQETL